MPNNTPTVAFRSEVRTSEPNVVKAGFSVRWAFEVRFSNSDRYVSYGARVVGKTAEAAIRLAVREALNHSDNLTAGR